MLHNTLAHYASLMNFVRVRVLFAAFAFFLCVSAATNASAQVSTYRFSAGGVFTQLVAPNVQTLAAGNLDDGNYPLAPIGFNFVYGGVTHTQVSASTNGWMRMGALANSDLTNNLTTGPPGARPVIAPLWDDIEVDATGSVAYLTEGSAPNRVFTMQWINMQWSYQALGPGISFQVKLYETSNQIQFIYRQEAAAVNNTTFGASIGITATATGSGNFISLSDSGENPSTSTTVETTTISTKPLTGQTYTFTPIGGTAISNYRFSSTKAFTPLVGANVQTLAGGNLDDGFYPAVPIGFFFFYDDGLFTQASASTQGWLRIGAIANDDGDNDIENGPDSGGRPAVMPLWDDLEVDALTGSVSYLTSGVAPNRVFTMQWLNMQWDSGAIAPVISLQVKLYEATNQVQFIYRQELAPINNGGGGASIGIAGTATGAGNFLSLNNSGTSPVASSTVGINNIAVKPATGQNYTFTPTFAPTAAGVSISGRVMTQDGRGLRNAVVMATDQNGNTRKTITSSFGYYSFEDMESGQTFVLSVASKRFQFSPQAVTVNDNLTDVNFTSGN
ncbi:MAG: carboxypeptidase regulatory-like domain-containing protein [Saprospiraceae bacterium]|nr:carboxypeptidase regulatory-like domain-containing protein [Pyrinomonadaceae bacterium]